MSFDDDFITYLFPWLVFSDLVGETCCNETFNRIRKEAFKKRHQKKNIANFKAKFLKF